MFSLSEAPLTSGHPNARGCSVMAVSGHFTKPASDSRIRLETT